MENYVFDLVSSAFRKVAAGKSGNADILDFKVDEFRHLAELAHDLVYGAYQHGVYAKFAVHDPKCRTINTASIRDRIVHRLVYDALVPLFEPRFIYDSYAARVGKGVHRARARFFKFAQRASKNLREEVFVLHGDVVKYFESVDHEMLLDGLRRVCCDGWLMNLVESVVRSYGNGKGMPIGSVTSQLFANVYLHELDRFMKHELGEDFYLRYNDDFFILTSTKSRAPELQTHISCWMRLNLKLNTTFSISRTSSGIDVLGAVSFPYGFVPRAKTRQKIDIMVSKTSLDSRDVRAVLSYLGSLDSMCGYWAQKRLLGVAGGL
ncbi:MAG: reverse transcriptase/maturase family protein [bacterium]